MLQYELSLTAALLVQARPHHCYANAWQALLTLPELFGQDGLLVEGWIVVELPHEVRVIEHCWDQRGELIIDPTVVLAGNKTLSTHFFAGSLLTRAQVAQLQVAQLPLVRTAGSFGPDGLLHPGYRQAYEDALALAESLKAESGKAIALHPSVALNPSASEGAPLLDSPSCLVVSIVPASQWGRGQGKALLSTMQAQASPETALRADGTTFGGEREAGHPGALQCGFLRTAAQAASNVERWLLSRRDAGAAPELQPLSGAIGRESEARG
jgi:hypothetical protein